MASSKDILKNVLKDLEVLDSFGVMFLAPNGDILYGSFTNEEYENLAVDITKRSFSSMHVSDFIQHRLGIQSENYLCLFKLAETVIVSIITTKPIEAALVTLNRVIKDYRQQLEKTVPTEASLTSIHDDLILIEPYVIRDRIKRAILQKIYEQIKKSGGIESIFFIEDTYFVDEGRSFADKEHGKLARRIVKKNFNHMNVGDFIRKTLESDTKLYVCKISEKITIAFLIKVKRGKILFQLNKIIEEFRPQLDEIFV